MAQYFYDFKDVKPFRSDPTQNQDAGPSGMKRLFAMGLSGANIGHFQDCSQARNGLDIWSANMPGQTSNFSQALKFGPDVMAADVECVVKLTEHLYTGGSFTNDGPGLMARVNTRLPGQSTYASYELATAGSPTSTNVFFRKFVNNSGTEIMNAGTGGPGTRNSKTWWMRWQVRDVNLRFRCWEDGVAEPSAWGYERTDSSIVDPGYFGFGLSGALGDGNLQGTRYRLHLLGFGTGADSAPTSLPRTVSGTLLAPDGSPASGYLARCYARDSGMLLGETLTNTIGAFSFDLNGYSKPVTVVGVDQLGNTWNAVIRDLVNPST
jgi:hypothetical protein